MTKEKVLENKLRRIAARRGYRIEKSKRRDPDSLTYGRYWVFRNNEIAGDIPGLQYDTGRECTVTLDQIEAAFTSQKQRVKPKRGKK